MGTLVSRPNSPRISLTRNITSAHTLEELKTQIGEFVNRLEDYLNSQIGIHFLQDNRRRPTLIAGDLVFDFTNHPEFATLQQWDGEKLIPLDLSAISGYIDLVAQGIGSGTDASLFLRSDGAGHWVLAAGPVGPVGPAGADGDSAYDVAVINGFVGSEADWLMSLIGADGAPGADGIDGSVWYNGPAAPGSGLGIDGDYYLRLSNGDVYFKSSGSWSVILNIIGPAGAPGADGINGIDGVDGAPGPGILYGPGIPSNSIGVDGQIYFDTIQGDIYYKVTGAWVFKPGNAHFLQGKGLDTSVIAPANGNILVYDSSLFSGVGGWKVAAPAGSSFSGMDDETRARLNLAIL